MISTNFFCAGNVGVREHVGVTGDTIPGHFHHFDHVTLFVQGRFRLRATDAQGVVVYDGEYTTGSFETIPSNYRHEIEWLEPGKLWCVYAHRDPQGQVIQRYEGYDLAYAARTSEEVRG